MTVVLVDWLGRGGIAQCSNAWVRAVEHAGHSANVVTAANREITGDHVLGITSRSGRISRHRRIAMEAARLIYRERPRTVIVQNYVVPALERPVAVAADKVGAKLVWVVHNHRAHSAMGGTNIGLQANLERSDAVVAHSQFVGERVKSGVGVTVLPHPVPPEYEPGPDDQALFRERDELLALHFGVLKRAYKGTSLVRELASRLQPGSPWTVGVIGVGAPPAKERLLSCSLFVPAGSLAATVAISTATLLPYRAATQSGAVALSQARGAIPIASAVGGIPEQIADGQTGLLLPAGANAGEWLAAMQKLESASYRDAISRACKVKSVRDQSDFNRMVAALLES